MSRVAVVFLLAVVCCVGCSGKSETDGVYVVPQYVDIGLLESTEEEVTAEFTIHNETDRDLVILDVFPSCTCTDVQVERKLIPPNGSSRIVAEANVPDVAGLQEYSMTVVTDDPSYPSFELTFSAAVKVSDGQNRDYTIGTFHPGAQVEVSVPAESFSDGQVSAVKVPPGSALRASLSGGGLSPMMLELTGEMPVDVGPFDQNVTLQVSYPEESGIGSGELVVRLRGMVISRWNVPDAIYGGFRSDDEGGLVSVKIDANPANGGPDIDVRDVRVSAESDWISLNQYEVSATGIELQMEIYSDRIPSPGALSNSIELEIEYENDAVERHAATFYLRT